MVYREIPKCGFVKQDNPTNYSPNNHLQAYNCRTTFQTTSQTIFSLLMACVKSPTFFKGVGEQLIHIAGALCVECPRFNPWYLQLVCYLMVAGDGKDPLSQ